MRIALWGNFVVPYTSESHYAESLESLGHEVIRLQETTVSTNRVLSESLRANMLVWIHTHGVQPRGWPVPEVLEEIRHHAIPTVAFHLDLFMPIHDRWQLYKNDPYFSVDHFFTVDNLMAQWFNAHSSTTKGYWLPPGVFHKECYISPPTDNLEVVFVGSRNYHREWTHRPQLINWLERVYGERFHHFGPDAQPIGNVVRGKDLNQVYANSKIVVGDSFCPQYRYQGKYWSDRATETLGRGGFLIHPRVPYMDEVFRDREHLVYYDFGNFQQLRGLIDYYLENDDKRERIRLTGHEYVKQEHTYQIRWKNIIDTVFPC